jgi:exo-1,4-beta-D-glucosaminidase
MLNNPWPGLIWHLFDYFHEPAASYFATKKANEEVHLQYAYNDSSIFISNSGVNDKDLLVASVQVYNLESE